MRTVHKKHRDRQRAFPVAEYCLCGGELYRAGECRRLSGRTLCGECAALWLLCVPKFCRLQTREVRG